VEDEMAIENDDSVDDGAKAEGERVALFVAAQRQGRSASLNAPSATAEPQVMPSGPAPAAAALSAKTPPEVFRLENVHAYLLLSDEWSVPEVEAERLTYSRWRRDGVKSKIDVPLKPASPNESPVPGLITAIAGLEERDDEDLKGDLRRLVSMRSIRTGPYHALREGGEDDNFNKKIGSLIVRTATFLVYLDDKDDVFYVTSPEFGVLPDGSGEIINRLSALLAEPIAHLSAPVRKSFRTLLAEGVARLLYDRSPRNADAVFNKAESFLRARNNESARLTYLGAAIPTTLIAILADVLLWKHKVALDQVFVPGFTVAAVAASMGAIGAFLSIFLRLTSVDIDAGAGKLLLRVECTLRVFVGVVVAAVVGWAVNANLLLGFTSAIAGGSMGTKMLIGLLSGASERAMPTLMKKFEATLDDGPPAGGAAAPPKPKESTSSASVVVKTAEVAPAD
jgi:hypothetical protein